MKIIVHKIALWETVTLRRLHIFRYHPLIKSSQFLIINRYRRKRPKVDASIYDSALSHTRRIGRVEKSEENSVSPFGRFRLLTSFESSPVSVRVA